MLLGFRNDVLVELRAPRLDRRGLREADRPLLVLRPRRPHAGRKIDGHRHAGGGSGHQLQEIATLHVLPPNCRDKGSGGGPEAAGSIGADRGAARRRLAMNSPRLRSCTSTVPTM